MPQHVSAQGYKLQFALQGFGVLTGKTLRVRVTRPDGTAFDRITPTDVVVLDDVKKLVGVKIKNGDLTIPGEYWYQAFDETAGVFIPTDKESFFVDSNLAVPAP